MATTLPKTEPQLPNMPIPRAEKKHHHQRRPEPTTLKKADTHEPIDTQLKERSPCEMEQ